MFIIDEVLEIRAPLDVVWEVVSDLPRYGDWNPFCLECRSTLKPGDPIDMKVRLTAKPQHQREWMLEYVEGRRFAYRMKPVPLGALSSYRSHELESMSDERTRYHSYFHLKGWFKPLVLALLRGKLQAGFDGMSMALKQRAEALWAERGSTARA